MGPYMKGSFASYEHEHPKYLGVPDNRMRTTAHGGVCFAALLSCPTDYAVQKCPQKSTKTVFVLGPRAGANVSTPADYE